MKKLAMRAGALTLGLLAAGSALATGPASPDLSALVPDFTTVTTAILAVAGAIIGVYVAWKGAKMVIRSVKGA